MKENKVIDVDLEVSVDETAKMQGAGEVQIADDVIAVIAEIAALEVDGVFAIAGGKNDIVQTIRGKKGAKGIKVEIIEDEVQVDLALNVKYGIKIQDTCKKVQEKVKNSIETMTGLNVQSVDVHVVGVDFSKTNPGEEH